MGVVAAGIELHHTSRVGDRLHARKREDNSNEASPISPEAAVEGLQMTDRSAQMWKTKKAERDDDDRRRNGDKKCETAGVFRAEQIKQANDEDRRGRAFLRMRDTEILKRG